MAEAGRPDLGGLLAEQHLSPALERAYRSRDLATRAALLPAPASLLSQVSHERQTYSWCMQRRWQLDSILIESQWRSPLEIYSCYLVRLNLNTAEVRVTHICTIYYTLYILEIIKPIYGFCSDDPVKYGSLSCPPLGYVVVKHLYPIPLHFPKMSVDNLRVGAWQAGSCASDNLGLPGLICGARTTEYRGIEGKGRNRKLTI